MEPIKVTFLGLSGSVPQKDKNFSSILISMRGENILFDCPEGTQKQLMKSDYSLMNIKHVFISHMHADHFLGLFGWISTMTLNQRKEKLIIYSPKKGKEKIQRILHEVVKPSFPIEYKELKKGVNLKHDLFEVRAFPLKHDVPCFGFTYKEKDKKGEFDREKAVKLGVPVGPLFSKLVNGGRVSIGKKVITQRDVLDYSKGRVGRKIVIVSDTLSFPQIVRESMGADLLIHESTFLSTQKERAIESMHSTALDAAINAKKAGAKKLALIHFSARNTNEEEILLDAKKEFEQTIIPKETQSILV